LYELPPDTADELHSRISSDAEGALTEWLTLTDNAAARAFAAQLPLTLDMSDLNGNEKHAD